MAVSLSALKTELTTDPTGLGYAAHIASGVTEELAKILNQPRSAILFDRLSVAAFEIFEAVAPTEWPAVPSAEKQRVQIVLSMGTVNLKGANTRAALQAAFDLSPITKANILALIKRQGSRAEELFGEGTSVTHLDVGEALAS